MTDTYARVEYYVVSGTIAGILTFQADVETQIEAGFAPLAYPTTDGTNIYQIMLKTVGSAFTATWFITAAPTTGTNGTGTFTISGEDVTLQFPPGFKFTVVGSSHNDGIYTVYPKSEYTGGNTVVYVKETIGDTTADGQIIQFAAVPSS